MISCQGVEPYLQGYKLHLQIGNPTNLTVNNAQLGVRWGAAYEAEKDFASWYKSLKETTLTLTENLKPGFWNDVDVIVSPATASELAYLKVSIKTDSVSLTRLPEHH